MSIPPLSPAVAALRVQVIGAVEADLIAALDAVQEQRAPDAKPAPQANPVRQAVDVARADAAGRQASLAPLFADLAQAQSSPALPAAVKAAIGQLLALQTPLSGLVTAQTVKRAIAQSGLFLEAHLAGPEQATEPDLKAVLMTLQRALAATPTPIAATKSAPTTTPPPAHDAALTAQAPAIATLSASDGAPAIVQHLLREVDGAMARQVLHQIASLPDGGAQAWMFELPIATSQGTALAQFEIDRDGAGPDASDPAKAWRVRFSIDIEPLGPVHIHLGLNGDRAAVTVWADREDGLERLRSHGAELSRALPADVVFRSGPPRRPVPESGRFVDQSS